MLKKLYALSDQGERELKHGIVATTIGHLCIMAPISLLMLVTMGLLNRLCGGDWTDNAARSDSSDGSGSLTFDLHNPMGSV